MGWSWVGKLHPFVDRDIFRMLLHMPLLLVPGSELLLCTSRVASPRADTCWVENLPWSIRFTISLRHQNLVRASELCGRV